MTVVPFITALRRKIAMIHINAVLRWLVKWFYTLFAVAAISLAVLVQSGRSFSPLLADYTKEISRYLSGQLNAKVSIGALRAEWDGLKPMLDVQDLRIASQTDEQIIALEHVQLRLDLLGSLLHFRLVWSSLKLDKVAMDFVQTENGFWHVSGLPRLADTAADEPSAQLDPLIDMTLLSRRIEFGHSQLNFHFVSGDTTSLASPLLRMENTGNFHRLTLDVDVDNKPKSLVLIAEGYGDPRHRESFSSKGYLQLREFPTNEPIAAATALLLHGINAQMHSEGALDASLWFSSRPGYEGFDVVGKLGLQRISVPVLNRKLSLDGFSTEIIGNWLYSGQWQLALQNISANINEHHLEKVNIAASADSFEAPLILHMQHLDLRRLNQSMDSAGVLGNSRLRDTLRQLDPYGELRNLQIAIPVQNPKEWELQANLAQVGVSAWQGVPALGKVDGFVHATQLGGFVDIDSKQGFSMHYYPTYAEPMEYQEAHGQVAWWLQPDNNQIYVNSGALEFISGNERAKGYMWLALPWTYGTGDEDLYLQIGATQLTASTYSKYTPAVLPSSLLAWLEKSIGPNNTGAVNQVGFLYRGTLNNRNHAARSHQLFLDINHAQLNYHPEWPALSELNGRLLVDNDVVSASVDSAKLFASDVAPTEIQVSPNPDGQGSLLQVNGRVSGSAGDGLRVLRESMLHRYIGSSLDSWVLDGQMQTQVNIAVPLERDGTGATQQIDIDLDASSFVMTNLRLPVQNIKGHISFNQDKGLASDELQATLFDEPVKVKLMTKNFEHESQTLVEVNGELSNKLLAKWTQRPEVLFLQGKIPYRAQIALNHRHENGDSELTAAQPYAEINVSSQMKGVAVDLPAPYGKSADTERPLIFKMDLYEKNSLINITYGDNLQVLLALDPAANSKLTNANIALASSAKLADTPMFLVSGNLPNFDITPWTAVQSRYQSYTDQIAIESKKSLDSDGANAFDGTLAGLPFRASIMLGRYEIGPLALENIAVIAECKSDAWKVQFGNPVAAGDIYLPNEKIKPMQINLQNLHLTSELLGINPTVVDAVDGVAGQPELRGPSVDPRALPFANVSVKSLFMDDKNYGSWSLQIRPNEQGALFGNIHGSVRGVTVGGADDVLDGAKLNWRVTSSGPQTHFIGSLSASDLSSVLREWQKPDTLESTAAHFRVDALWLGDPQDFALKNLRGNMDIWVEKGRFKNNPGVGSDGFLRLMAVLNFDSLARRLRLDFSDLYTSGLAYDQISGKVNFDSGAMTFSEPLMVKTPSSRLQMAGKLDLANEKINTRLVATLPVVGNFTFFTALVTGLPAAAGIYLVSKLFKKQVDQATSISYKIEGDWSNPVMSFDRLFESEDALIENASKTESKKTNSTKTLNPPLKVTAP